MQEKQLKEVNITVHPRIHITLIGMNAGGYRINGGCGFAIDEPSANLRCSSAKTFNLADYRGSALPAGEAERLRFVVNNEQGRLKLSHNISVVITGQMPTHYGFGSDTAIRLGCLEALYFFNDVKTTSEQIVLSSGRGGTSGVGINTYYSGGCVFDLGVGSGSQHLPSSTKENRKELPLLMQRLEMPIWDIGVCIPNSIHNKSEDEEQEFFRRICPIPAFDAYETLYNVVYGLYAAVRENNKNTFIAAINSIQMNRWKSAERAEYGKELVIIDAILRQSGASAVGLSSLGPSLFFFADDVGSVIEKVNKEQINCSLFSTKPVNEGRKIQFV